MTPLTVAALALLIFAAALLYSSVGHAGASAYLAAMALFGLEPAVMKPTALCLNILVAGITTYQFWRGGSFSWTLFWPFAATSIPAAYLGGGFTLPGAYYKPLVGLVLLFAAYRLFRVTKASVSMETKPPPIAVGISVGAAIGFLSGLTGTGGGIFLSPLLLLFRWADPRHAAGVSASFVLVNSVAGILGLIASWRHIPQAIPIWALAAVAGGLTGSHFGSRRFGNLTIRRLLAAVLVIAGLKLLSNV